MIKTTCLNAAMEECLLIQRQMRSANFTKTHILSHASRSWTHHLLRALLEDKVHLNPRHQAACAHSRHLIQPSPPSRTGSLPPLPSGPVVNKAGIKVDFLSDLCFPFCPTSRWPNMSTRRDTQLQGLPQLGAGDKEKSTYFVFILFLESRLTSNILGSQQWP